MAKSFTPNFSPAGGLWPWLERHPAPAGWLPRFWLDRLELAGPDRHLPDPEATDELVRRFGDLRIALVRQEVFDDLYRGDLGVRGEELVRQSVKRTGPAGLPVDLGADYWIVREDPAPECRVWEEKFSGDPSAALERYRRESRIPFAPRAVPCAEVPWEDYDLVITVDVAVPFALMARTRRPVWAYLPGDPGTVTAKRSLRRPPGNYHLALSHSFRRLAVRPSLGPRTVEFPYGFLRRKTWQRVFPETDGSPREGIMLESHTAALMGEEERREFQPWGPLRRPSGPIRQVAADLNASQFYLRCGGRPLVGNGLIEAVAAGCVAVGPPGEFISRSLLTGLGPVRNRGEAAAEIRRLAEDPDRCRRVREAQGRRLDYYCFHRPAEDLWRAWRQVRGKATREPRAPKGRAA